MAWYIKKTSMITSAGTVYYAGGNRWTSTYADRARYSSQAKAKAEDYIWGRNKWDVTAVDESAGE